jgi:radical SAM superfamily enzyme YgiQ (UPF0313 family)
MKQDIFLAKVKIKIVFVVPTKKAEYLGVQLLSAYLKRKGFFNIKAESYNSPLVMELARQESRVIFAFCLFTPFVKEFLDLCRKIKEVNKNSVCIFGGPHPLFKPEIIQSPGVDAICLGEGEEALAEFVEKYYQCGQLPLDVDNFWVKDKQGRVHKNKLRPLVNLDNLPVADMGLFRNAYTFKEGFRRFIVSRGCLFKCRYCSAMHFCDIYNMSGKQYYRICSARRTVEQIRKGLELYGGKAIGFVDSIFGHNRAWLDEFSFYYRKFIGLPFYCNTLVEMVENTYLDILKKSGCYFIYFGLETANEKIRANVLNKHYTNQQLFKAVKLTKEKKLKLGVYNMIGIPGATLKDDLYTLDINKKIDPDIPDCKVYSFFPGTDLYNEYNEKDSLDSDNRPIYNVYWSVINNCRIRKDLPKLLRLNCLFNIFVYCKVPSSLECILIKLPLHFLYKIFALLVIKSKLYYRKMKV